MLKAAQQNVGSSWQGSRLGAATNGFSAGSEGQSAEKRVWGVYGGKESPQVIVGKVTQCSLGDTGDLWLSCSIFKHQ